MYSSRYLLEIICIQKRSKKTKNGLYLAFMFRIQINISQYQYRLLTAFRFAFNRALRLHNALTLTLY